MAGAALFPVWLGRTARSVDRRVDDGGGSSDGEGLEPDFNAGALARDAACEDGLTEAIGLGGAGQAGLLESHGDAKLVDARFAGAGEAVGKVDGGEGLGAVDAQNGLL